MKELNNYFMVIAKCGHVGKRNYIPIKFAVHATDAKDAAKITRDFPRVKRNHKDAILKVEKISYEEYLEIKKINDEDPYLKCKSKQEQNMIDNLSERLEVDLHNQDIEYDKTARKSRIQYKLRKYKEISKSLYKEVYSYAN